MRLIIRRRFCTTPCMNCKGIPQQRMPFHDVTISPGSCTGLRFDVSNVFLSIALALHSGEKIFDPLMRKVEAEAQNTNLLIVLSLFPEKQEVSSAHSA